MKKRKKVMVVILFLFVIILLVAIIPMLTNPMRRPRNIIRHQVLRITPIGMNIDDVIEVIERRDDWGEPIVSYEFGFAPLSPGRRRPLPAELGLPDLPRVGKMSISSYMGNYRNWFMLLVVDVTIFWAFDEDGKLIDVHIWKAGGG